jgi:hypothetical protein
VQAVRRADKREAQNKQRSEPSAVSPLQLATQRRAGVYGVRPHKGQEGRAVQGRRQGCTACPAAAPTVVQHPQLLLALVVLGDVAVLKSGAGVRLIHLRQ